MRHYVLLPGMGLAAVGLWLIIGTCNAQTAPNLGSRADAAPPGRALALAGSPHMRGRDAREVRWSEAQIASARARCDRLLDSVGIVAIPAEPFRNARCGAPAPIQLISLGTDPQVSLSPPPVLTCEMAAALGRWLEAEVQPAARELLGGSIIRLEVMSAYSCRNAYARLRARLSEHGRANALDIAMFVTDRGETAHILDGWGDTARDTPISPSTALMPPGKASLGASLTAGATRLGGPPSPGAATSRQPSAQFLRRIHAGACRHFSTVLGPEANEAHRNHFHLDAAARGTGSYCH